MFIKVTLTGGRRYAQLVESFRNEAGQPRQRTLATLGRLEPGGEVDRLVGALQRAQGRDDTRPGGSVSAEDLRFIESRDAGDVWALWQLWSALDLDGLALAWSRSKASAQTLACLRAMVFNRLCDPASKLGVLRWLETVALPVGFGFDGTLPDHQHLLRAMDVLDAHAPAIAKRLAFLMRPLIDQELSVVFYDLTTVKVHGEAVIDDDVRAFGHAKDGGVDRQFVLSLVQTAEGLPIAHDVHPGNMAESKTLLPMIRSLLERWPLKRVVLVADRGLLSLNNLEEIARLQAELDALGRNVRLEYVLAVPAARYGEFRTELLGLDEQHDPATSWVAELPWKSEDRHGQGRTHRLVVAHDPKAAQRRIQARRKQMDELIALGEQWGGRLDEQDAGRRRRGRPLSDSGAKARLYHAVKDASLAHLIRVDLKSDLFRFSVDEAQLNYLERLDGKLVVVTNTDAPADQVIERYRSLADIERGFRVLKSEIEIGPVYHRLPRRIRAHALVCFLALLLHRVLRMRLRASQRTESPARLLEQLRRLQHQRVQIGRGPTISGLTALAPAQKELFAAIGLPVPTPAQLEEALPHLAPDL
jgi:transposase